MNLLVSDFMDFLERSFIADVFVDHLPSLFAARDVYDANEERRMYTPAVVCLPAQDAPRIDHACCHSSARLSQSKNRAVSLFVKTA